MAVIGLRLAALRSWFGGRTVDVPEMENWESFSVSRSDSYAQHNFYISVKRHKGRYVVSGTLRDDRGTEYEENRGIVLPRKACVKIDALQPQNLPDVTASGKISPDEDLIVLDVPEVQVEVVYPDGTLNPKVDAEDFSIRVYQIVLPHFK
jgi:hypothetical protein